MDKPDYYAILGVAKDASPEEIRTAFEQAQAAPGGDENSALAEAYDVLSDPQRRIFYDQQVYVTATVPRRRSGPEAGASAAASKAIRPRDAATLIIVDAASGTPRILMGRRRDDVVFMPGKYVFPGGRVDREDRLVSSADDLAPGEIARLMHDMKGAASEARARAIALAAVRETWEEAGLVIGVEEAVAASAGGARSASWSSFLALGYRPRLAPLKLFARAITPPGRPRRYDTRFFCVEASAIAHRSELNDGELSGLHWMTLDEARALDVPHITRVILEDLTDRLRFGPISSTEAPVPYYHHKNGSFRRDILPDPPR